MERLKEFMIRILRPGAGWAFVLTILSATALVSTFAAHRETTLFGYISYALSAYTLAVLVVLSSKIAVKIKPLMNTSKHKNDLKTIIHKNKYTSRFMIDTPYRVKAILIASLSLTLLYAAFKLLAGIYYASFWYGADAVYYLVLSTVRFLLLRHMRKEQRDLDKEYRLYRSCGYLLLVVNATLIGVVYQIVNQDMGYQYPGLMIYVVATFTFGFLVTAIINVAQYRKLSRPLFSAVMMTSLAQALVSIFALQTAMFVSFGDSESKAFEGLINSLTGAGVCIAIFGVAIYMIVRANQNLKARGAAL